MSCKCQALHVDDPFFNQCQAAAGHLSISGFKSNISKLYHAWTWQLISTTHMLCRYDDVKIGFN
jgi:hypothetical protein